MGVQAAKKGVTKKCMDEKYHKRLHSFKHECMSALEDARQRTSVHYRQATYHEYIYIIIIYKLKVN